MEIIKLVISIIVYFTCIKNTLLILKINLKTLFKIVISSIIYILVFKKKVLSNLYIKIV